MTIGLPLILRVMVTARYEPRMAEDPADIPGGRTAIIFGAAVRGGVPSAVLRDRLDAAIQLYREGRVTHLLMSGDGRADDYDEPTVMARYAVAQGVPEQAITRDRLGLRTYDTCYRGRVIYGLERVVLVTQRFHLPRAMLTCELLGLDVLGLAADRRVYRSAHWYELRELAALIVAGWDVLVRPLPGGGLGP